MTMTIFFKSYSGNIFAIPYKNLIKIINTESIITIHFVSPEKESKSDWINIAYDNGQDAKTAMFNFYKACANNVGAFFFMPYNPNFQIKRS